ncbi:SDR family NAD(P)-dependent oxidoreductase [Nocardia sp. AG03]|uniref:SDR family NAD(P)-dependent oxidoreductase n=1 Tax=Nocardia sp. AG03 TaxID=3025312 RepID=UPI0024186DE7|nr:SDR family NAD(P)-dependent oxidoreductase [Nocardia sp. AG03]
MRTLVVTGGTDGIGRHLADHYLARGDRVVVIGRDPAKGAAFRASAGERGTFLRADLDSTERNRAVLTELLAEHPRIDALVLCARFYRSHRTTTADGLEATFAHFYLSRYLFSHGLRDALERAADPVIVNVAGPGAPLSAARLDDLQLTRNYHGGAALGHNGKLNDLLGVSFAEQYRDGHTRYVLVHPGVTATAHTGAYDTPTRAMVAAMARTAKPVASAARPIIDVLDAPPRAPLAAFVEGRRIPVDGPDFDPAAARLLAARTRDLLAER